jgi:hypothetical protein
VAANRIAIGPPSSVPQIAALSEPAASITASTSSIWSSSVGAPKNGSESPEPRLSKVITRANCVRRAITRSSEGSDQRYSTWDIHGGIQIRSIGPSPSTVYAMWRSPLFA